MSSPQPTVAAPRIVVLMPVFNDWASAGVVVARTRTALGARCPGLRIVVVDDGSTAPMPEDAVRGCEVLRLRRNLGHQRAICVGLCAIHDGGAGGAAPDAVVVMDADGEDAPEDIAALLDEHGRAPGEVVFAARTRRSEGLVFAVFYGLYRVLHRALTGHAVRVGNFSVMPAGVLRQVVVASELWNHYAACVYKCRVPFRSVPIPRARRIAGRSSMGFTGLVVHGLSAMSVFADAIGTRILAASASVAALGLMGLIAALVGQAFRPYSVPGWAAIIAALVFIIILQAINVSLFFMFGTLASRQQASFIPLRDYRWFLDAGAA